MVHGKLILPSGEVLEGAQLLTTSLGFFQGSLGSMDWDACLFLPYHGRFGDDKFHLKEVRLGEEWRPASSITPADGPSITGRCLMYNFPTTESTSFVFLSLCLTKILYFSIFRFFSLSPKQWFRYES